MDIIYKNNKEYQHMLIFTYAITIVFDFLRITMFVLPSEAIWAKLRMLFTFILFFMVGLKLIELFKNNSKRAIIVLSILIVFGMNALTLGMDLTCVKIVCGLVILEGMPIKKVFSIHLIICSICLAITTLCALLGIIPNVIFDGNKNLLGMTYNTLYGMVLLIIFVCFIYVNKTCDKIWLFAAVGIVISTFFYIIQRAQTCYMVAVFFALLVMAKSIADKLNIQFLSIIYKVGKSILVAFPVMSVLVMFPLQILYNNGWLQKHGVKGTFLSRLSFQDFVMNHYGVKLFGQILPIYGRASSMLLDGTGPESAFFLDNAFYSLLYHYGILICVIFYIVLQYMAVKQFKSNNDYLLFIIASIALWTVSENTLTVCAVASIFMVMPLADCETEVAVRRWRVVDFKKNVTIYIILSLALWLVAYIDVGYAPYSKGIDEIESISLERARPVEMKYAGSARHEGILLELDVTDERVINNSVLRVTVTDRETNELCGSSVVPLDNLQNGINKVQCIFSDGEIQEGHWLLLNINAEGIEDNCVTLKSYAILQKYNSYAFYIWLFMTVLYSVWMYLKCYDSIRETNVA